MKEINNFYRRYGKRVLDLALTIPALIIFSPVIGLVALAVRWRLGHPVFFRQERPGLNGQLFTMIKFRTMTNACDSEGNLLPDNQRETRLGIFLRRTSLDELPQLINVLKGDMSLVGPRPLFKQYLPYYTERESTRHLVRPGITGLAQVSGRNFVPWDRRLALDAWYVDRLSLKLDLQIMMKTVIKVVLGTGANSGPIVEVPMNLERSRSFNLPT
jgi:lipopolysaccharide/colanic/teichoic acid biosynthesis glycosyltransferase